MPPSRRRNGSHRGGDEKGCRLIIPEDAFGVCGWDPPAFWAKLAKEELHWFEPFTQALKWDEPQAEWFVGGKTNASYNCLDKHVAAGRGDRTALIWEGEPGDKRQYTYAELLREVCKFANVLKSLGTNRATSSRSTCR